MRSEVARVNQLSHEHDARLAQLHDVRSPPCRPTVTSLGTCPVRTTDLGDIRSGTPDQEHSDIACACNVVARDPARGAPQGQRFARNRSRHQSVQVVAENAQLRQQTRDYLALQSKLQSLEVCAHLYVCMMRDTAAGGHQAPERTAGLLGSAGAAPEGAVGCPAKGSCHQCTEARGGGGQAGMLSDGPLAGLTSHSSTRPPCDTLRRWSSKSASWSSATRSVRPCCNKCYGPPRSTSRASWMRATRPGRPSSTARFVCSGVCGLA